jgi:hypothetical protein
VVPNPDKDMSEKENYWLISLLNILLENTSSQWNTENHIQQHIKRIRHHDQVVLLSEMQ